MRIQVNKLGLSAVEMPFAFKKWPAETHHRRQLWSFLPHDIYVAHFCPHCGTELFGHWKRTQAWINSDECRMYALSYQTKDPKKCELLLHDILYLEQIENRFEKSNTLLDQEVRDIIHLENCPCCGKALLREKGFLTSYNSTGNYVGTWYGEVEEEGYYEWERFNRDADFRITKDLSWSERSPLDEMFSILKGIRKKAERAAAKNAVHLLLESPVEPASVPSTAPLAENDASTLKDYLQKVLQTEVNIYSLSQRLETLYGLRFDTDRFAFQSVAASALHLKEALNSASQDYEDAAKYLAQIKSAAPKSVFIEMPKLPQQPMPPVLETPGFFNKKKVLAHNAELTAKYEAACQVYHADMAAYNAQLEDRRLRIDRLTKENERQHQLEIETATQKVTSAEQALKTAQDDLDAYTDSTEVPATPENAQKELLHAEIARAEAMLRSLLSCRHNLYACNIIFEKYRDLVAVSTFYEYLAAGRCTTLTGSSGAYNLYESEIRANLIISQLTNILSSLDQIQKNQYLVYHEIQTVNKQLQSLQNTMQTAAKSIAGIKANTDNMSKHMEHISKNSDVIAHNTAVNAYYSKINAELTDALGYMVALR